MKLLSACDRSVWRSWLQRNHQNSNEIWLVFSKKNSGKVSVSYDDAVEEALCFGWIDSIVKGLDDKRYIQRFTPRKPRSQWSAPNIQRVKRLIKQGKVYPAGLEAFKDHKQRRATPLPTALPKELELDFRRDAFAWNRFNAFPPSYRRNSIGWVASAKKPETRIKRLHQLVEASKRNERIKFI